VSDNLRTATLVQRSTNENELLINDPYQATTLNAAIQNLESAKNCSFEAIDYWLKLATASCASPREALKDLLAYMDYLISNGQCQPKKTITKKTMEKKFNHC